MLRLAKALHATLGYEESLFNFGNAADIICVRIPEPF